MHTVDTATVMRTPYPTYPTKSGRTGGRVTYYGLWLCNVVLLWVTRMYGVFVVVLGHSITIAAGSLYDLCCLSISKSIFPCIADRQRQWFPFHFSVTGDTDTYIYSPHQCLPFAAHDHTIATCFAILILQQNRLRCYGHVLRKEDTDWVKKCVEYEVESSRPRGRPKRT